MNDLIARLESAEAGSRELSDEVLLALGWEKTTCSWTDARGRKMQPYPAWITSDKITQGYYYRAPCPTTGLDAALALVRPGWRITHAYWNFEDKAHFTLGHAEKNRWVDGNGRLPAPALSAAILRSVGVEDD